MGIRYKFGRPPDECAAAWLRAPILLDIGAASGFYLVPPRVTAEGMHLGLKIGDHSSGPSGDPDRDREPGAVECTAKHREGDRVTRGADDRLLVLIVIPRFHLSALAAV